MTFKERLQHCARCGGNEDGIAIFEKERGCYFPVCNCCLMRSATTADYVRNMREVKLEDIAKE